MNKEGKFSQFDGLNVYGFTVLNSYLFGGDSISDNLTGGYLRQLDYGTTDDGAAVTASATLKHQELTYGDYEKNLSKVYFNYGVDVGTFTASILENFSEETTPYTVQFGSGTTINRWELEIDNGTTAKQFGLKFLNNYPGSRLMLYPGITYHFEKARLIQQ